MKRTLRLVLFRLPLLLCTLLALISLALWHSGHYGLDQWAYARPGSPMVMVTATEGLLYIDVVANWPGHLARHTTNGSVQHIGPVFFGAVNRHQTWRGHDVMLKTGYMSIPTRRGKIYLAEDCPNDEWNNADAWLLRRGFEISAPAWYFAVTFALPPTLWLLAQLPRVVRTRRRVANGLCTQCGYDLRATPHQCPECGHSTPNRHYHPIPGT